jgi:hypothetical protein
MHGMLQISSCVQQLIRTVIIKRYRCFRLGMNFKAKIWQKLGTYGVSLAMTIDIDNDIDKTSCQEEK